MNNNYVCESSKEVVKALSKMAELGQSGSIQYADCVCLYAFFKMDTGITKIFCGYSYNEDAQIESLEVGGYYFKGEFYGVNPFNLLPCNRGEEKSVLPMMSLEHLREWVETAPFLAQKLLECKYPCFDALKEALPELVEKMQSNFSSNKESLKERILIGAEKDMAHSFQWIAKELTTEEKILLCAGTLSVETLVNRVIHRNEDACIKSLSYYYLRENYTKEVLLNASAEEKVLRGIAQSGRKMGLKDKATITIRVAGDDSHLEEYVGRLRPEFTISGKVVTIKVSFAEFLESWTEGVFDVPYGAKLEPNVKERYSNNNIRYLSEIPLSAITSITYGKKTLYQAAD